jgi:hypothetical protein
MDRRERIDDPVEATRAAIEGKQAEIWTALPGIVESFDPVAMTVSVQPAVKGQIQDEAGASKPVNLPVLVDVPVVFPCGGGFTLTHPVKTGDECLVVIASRCIDGWWQGGGVGGTPDQRMHDLSDGIAIVGPRSQAGKLSPPVDPDNVQLRTDDGQAHITMMPDYTIKAENPQASVTITPGGDVMLKGSASINLDAPSIVISGNLQWTGQGGAAGAYSIKGALSLDGALDSTGDQTAAGISTAHHTHPGDSGGTTGEPT